MMRRDYVIFPGDIARLGRAGAAREEAEALENDNTSDDLRKLYWLYHDEAVALQSTDSVPIVAFCEARIQEIQVIQNTLKERLEERDEPLRAPQPHGDAGAGYVIQLDTKLPLPVSSVGEKVYQDLLETLGKLLGDLGWATQFMLQEEAYVGYSTGIEIQVLLAGKGIACHLTVSGGVS